MIAKFHKSDRGLAVAVLLLAGLTLVTLTDAQTQPQTTRAKSGEPDAAKGVWVVRFEPVGDFSPKTPAEYLERIHVYSGQHGMIGYFRTQKQGDRLLGSFLASDPDQLKAALAEVPGLKVTSVQKLTQEQLARQEFKPDFSSSEPLRSLGLTPRVAEVLLWVAQGKTNADIATILGISESTVKKHLLEIFQVLGVETRSAATLRALETLGSPAAVRRKT